MKNFDSIFWKCIAVLFVSSLFFLSYAILNTSGARNFALPGPALAQDAQQMNPGGGIVCTSKSDTNDNTLYIWKYDSNGLPVCVTIVYRQKDWNYDTYPIREAAKK
ncbi:MAG TPA: hypothetical protein PKK26_04815 [Candidatus Wallbacteria bacterium]|nr:hypothetical protein [Candidatus Wallbacteria bacterium]